jgi:membrane protease YdiL (CAAX protease family)
VSGPGFERPGNARRFLRVAGRALGSLLLGAVAIVSAVLLVRQGLLPLVDAVFQPGAEWLSAFRRVGILLAAVTAYWLYVRWHEKREATELRLQPLRLVLGGIGGAALVGLPIAVLFAVGAYELLLFRGFSPALLGVAGVIGVAATLEELVYRCLLFRVLERLGNGVGAVDTSTCVRGDASCAMSSKAESATWWRCWCR